MTTSDVGVWREQRGTYPAADVAALPGLLFAVHEAAAGLDAGCREQCLAPDWTRARVDVHRSGAQMVVVVGAWCLPDGSAVEYGFPIDAEPTLDDPPAPWRVEFIDERYAREGPGEPWGEPPWTRVVGPWRELSS